LLQPNVLEFSPFDDLLLNILGTRTGSRLRLIARWTVQESPSVKGQVFREFAKTWHRVDAKYELHAVSIPAIQGLRWREVGVVPHDDLAKACTAA